MPLFDVLPPDLFKPLASVSRRLHADLLLHLHAALFTLGTEAPRRGELVREIESFLSRWEAANGKASDEEIEGTETSDRARALYTRLAETGWLVEYQERYVKRVDLDPEASGLLKLLADIERGETRSYGGAVLGVLSALESASADPQDRSENLHNALIGSTEFMAHMRTVSVSLRRAEERILAQPTLRDLFRHFFEEFVERHLIRDFKTLHTHENPFRFRSGIISQADRMAHDEALLVLLGRSYAREGRAADEAAGVEKVREELAQIVGVFEASEAHLAAIADTVSRIERRIVNTARYMDRAGRASEVNVADALRAVAAVSCDTIDVATAFLPRGLPIGPPHIPAPRPDRPAVGQTVIHDIARDPAALLYARAKEEYVRRTRVTAPVLADYVERALGKAPEIHGRDMPVETVDDFVAFQRLREIPSIFGGALARRYELVLLPGRCSNEWISCQDFLIRRRNDKSAHAA